jgi:hypothetical protein
MASMLFGTNKSEMPLEVQPALTFRGLDPSTRERNVGRQAPRCDGKTMTPKRARSLLSDQLRREQPLWTGASEHVAVGRASWAVASTI